MIDVVVITGLVVITLLVIVALLRLGRQQSHSYPRRHPLCRRTRTGRLGLASAGDRPAA